jgi:hypothetical protein
VDSISTKEVYTYTKLKKLHNVKLHDLCPLSSIIQVIITGRMG